MSDRLCPKCGDPLLQIQVAAHVLDKCMRCKGLWFDNGELADLLREAYADEQALAQTDAPFGATFREATNQCPVCDVALDAVSSLRFQGLEMDTCPRCGGIWLDLGEFTRLRHQEQGRPPVSTSTYSSGSGAPLNVLGIVDDLHRVAFRGATEADATYLRELRSVRSRIVPPANVPHQHIPSDVQQWRGSIELALTDFSHQKVVSTDEVVAALEILPDRHLHGLHMVSYDPSPPKPRERGYWYFRRDRRSRIKIDHHDPFDYRDLGRLVIHAFQTKHEFLERLFHEIGHYVYFSILTIAGQSRWRDDVFPSATGFVSETAARNAMEGFAETYMHYVLWPDKLRDTHPDQYDFMADGVFLGFHPDVANLGLTE